MRQYKVRTSGMFKVRPGRRVIWLSRPSRISLMLVGGAMACGVLGAVALGVPVFPMVINVVRPGTSVGLTRVLGQQVATQSQKEMKIVDTWQPAFDLSLPEGNWVGTQKIGLKTLVREAAADDYEDALKLGVWRVPDFGTPENRQLPMILSAHRFGYLKWSNAYRRENSFFNLPKLEIGDWVYVVWAKRKYVYEIYKADEGREISDYSADLILYTCKYLESPIRIFRYARLVKE